MIGAMPDFWKLYYQAASEKPDYRPTDPGVFRQSAVDQKAKLISALDPPSNEFAQANGVAGIALYHAVVGSDGKVEEVVAGPGRSVLVWMKAPSKPFARRLSSPLSKTASRLRSRSICWFRSEFIRSALRARSTRNEPEAGNAGVTGTLYRGDSAGVEPETLTESKVHYSRLDSAAFRGSHSSIRFPSGSHIHAKRPYP